MSQSTNSNKLRLIITYPDRKDIPADPCVDDTNDVKEIRLPTTTQPLLSSQSQKKVELRSVLLPPKVFVYTVCYNEEFMVPYFLKHYSFAEKIFVYDNGSTDRSVDLLRQDPRCEVFSFTSKFNDDINRKIKNNCWKRHRGQCDYVIVCDFDEFLHSNIPIIDILQHFRNKNISIDLFKAKGFNMASEAPLDPGLPLVEQVSHGVLDPMYSKVVLFNPNTIRDINYTHGAHEARPVGIRKRLRLGPALNLLHYKFVGGIPRVHARYRELKQRLSQFNLKHRMGLQYLTDPTATYKKLIRQAVRLF